MSSTGFSVKKEFGAFFGSVGATVGSITGDLVGEIFAIGCCGFLVEGKAVISIGIAVRIFGQHGSRQVDGSSERPVQISTQNIGFGPPSVEHGI